MYFFEFNKLFFLSRIFDGIEIPIGKFQIKDGDKIKLDDEEVGEVAIAKKQKFIKCKVQNTEKCDECTYETRVQKAGVNFHPFISIICYLGSTDVDSWRMRISINGWSLYDLKRNL
jgi:hypothetical protein